MVIECIDLPIKPFYDTTPLRSYMANHTPSPSPSSSREYTIVYPRHIPNYDCVPLADCGRHNDDFDDEYEWETRHYVASFLFSMIMLVLFPLLIAFILAFIVPVGSCEVMILVLRWTFYFFTRHVVCRLWRRLLVRCQGA